MFKGSLLSKGGHLTRRFAEVTGMINLAAGNPPSLRQTKRGGAKNKGALNCDLFPFGRGSLPWLGGGFNCYESFSGHPAPEKGQKNLLPGYWVLGIGY